MAYERQVLSSHKTIVKAGNGSTLKVVYPLGTDTMTGISSGYGEIKAYFAQTSYSAQELSDSSIASGLTKLLVSPLDEDGNVIKDFSQILKNKKSYVKFSDDESTVSIKVVRLTQPDHNTVLLARVYIGG